MVSRVLATGATLGAVVLAAAGWLTWEARSAPDVERLADAFVAPAAWEPTDETVHGWSPLCWDGHRCPSLNRAWTAPGPVTDAELGALVDAAGWSVTADGPCAPDEQTASTIRRSNVEAALCTLDGTAGPAGGGLPVRLRLGTRDPSGSPTHVELWVN